MCLLVKSSHMSGTSTSTQYYILDLVSDLEWSILAVDTPQWHQYCSSHHHTQYPTHCSYTSPLCLHLEYYHPPVAVDQLCMELQQN